jgi:ADP-ribosylglycohydrolase
MGRISGCMLGKAVEMFSMREGYAALESYLQQANALPLRDYVPLIDSDRRTPITGTCCKDHLSRSEPDDDINYSVLSLLLLEAHGADLQTVDVARAWLKYLPVAMTFTAERAAYRILLNNAQEWFPEGAEAGFDLSECSDNPYNDWIGAQIRADLYGWVCPGNPELAARLARADAELSHRDDGVLGAVFVAVMGALIPASASMDEAVAQALAFIPGNSGAAEAAMLGRDLANEPDGDAVIRERYHDLSPVHTLNNLALVVWALVRHPDDFSAAIGDVVAAGLDTDCNGATVGGLWGLQGKPIPTPWLAPWDGKVGVSLAGHNELSLDTLVERTEKIAKAIAP